MSRRFFSCSLSPVLLCYVVGSRRLMPPDALQPKAYCTNPGLQSFLLAPPGVSTRDPSSESRNYLGEKWPVIWTESCDFHAYTYMPQIWDMGQTVLLPFRREACWGFFFHQEKSDDFCRIWTRELPLDHRNRSLSLLLHTMPCLPKPLFMQTCHHQVEMSVCNMT